MSRIRQSAKSAAPTVATTADSGDVPQESAGSSQRSAASRSKTREPADAPTVAAGDESLPVSAVSADFPSGHRIARHQHRRAQLVYAVEGVMTVETDVGLWVVPPLRAVWVPARIVHSIRMTGLVRMRTVYFTAEALAAAKSPDRPAVLTVSPLLRELIVRVVECSDVDANSKTVKPRPARLENVVELLLEELTAASVSPLEIPVPSDRRLRRISDALMADPSDARDQPAWARMAGISERTLARLFPEQTGMTLVHWRQQVRLLRALERLALGESVTTVTMDLGYTSVSAFVRLFRDSFGVTPGRYFDP
jgi:AraC-like DNA-binding protein/quercetin dioxygenase-like cupin family protein